MYLFQPKQQSLAEPADSPDGTAAAQVAGSQSFGDVLPSLNTSALQPGSAAEWAIGELLIRLCNGGRALRTEPGETPADE